jgi:murein hydrolase activator
LFVLFHSFLSLSVFFGWLLIGCLGINVSQAQDDEQKELERLRAHIRELQSQLAQSRHDRDALFAGLQKIELAIGNTAKQLAQLDQRIADKTHHLQALQAKYARLHHSRSYQREILTQQIRRAYLASRQEMLKLFLSQEDLVSFGRSLIYFNYFHQSRNQRINQISQILNAIAELQSTIHSEQAQLSQLQLQMAHKQERLQADYQARSKILVQQESKIQEQDARLRILREDARNLEQIVSSLHQLLLDIPAEALHTKPFRNLRGQLLWPCQGRIVQHFGSLHAPGEYRSQGIIITAEQGDPVRAVFHGRVAFADWLRGYGLLLILDHGDGYMTLYGHNQSLFKEVGDWVDTGEIIARAGNSGGHHQSGVYFELRQQGKPADPLSWLRKPS